MYAESQSNEFLDDSTLESQLAEQESWALQNLADLRPSGSIDLAELSYRAGLAAGATQAVTLAKRQKVQTFAVSISSALVGGVVCWMVLAAIPSLLWRATEEDAIAEANSTKSTSGINTETQSGLAGNSKSHGSLHDVAEERLIGRWANIMKAAQVSSSADRDQQSTNSGHSSATPSVNAEPRSTESLPYYRMRQQWSYDPVLNDFS